MPSITAPYVETQQVVTGFMYQLHIAEEAGGPGITRMDIGPYFFGGVPSQSKYPEAVTNEMTPPGWAAIRWFTDESGASWLRWEGGRLESEYGEALFQVTSNYAPSRTDAGLVVWRGRRGSERYSIAAPDYSQPPPANNPRHDVKGQAAFAQGAGCAPPLALALVTLAGMAELARRWLL